MEELKLKKTVAFRFFVDLFIYAAFTVIILHITWHDLITLKTEAIVVVSLAIIIISLPILIITVSYFLEDYDKQIFIDKTNRILLVKRRGKEIRFAMADVIKAYYVKAMAKRYKNGGAKRFEYIAFVLPENR